MDAQSVAGAENGFSLVRDELLSTLAEARDCLEAFTRQRHRVADMQKGIDLLRQLRGSFELIELPGAGLLAEELARLGEEVPAESGADKDGLLETLAFGMFRLTRYLEYYQRQKLDLAVLLVPTINEIRRARQAPAINEGYFYQPYRLQPVSLALTRAEVPEATLKRNLRRLRHMYQVGLLGVIREEKINASIKLMLRALRSCVGMVGGSRLANLLQTAVAALVAMSEESYLLTRERKLMLAQLDRVFKDIAREGEKALNRDPQAGLLTDLLFILSLSRSEHLPVVRAKIAYTVSDFVCSEAQLSQQRFILQGPDDAAIGSVTLALSDEITEIKDYLDLTFRGAPDYQELQEINQRLARIERTLALLGLESAASLIQPLMQRIELWRLGELTPQPETDIAETILLVEAQIKALSHQHPVLGNWPEAPTEPNRSQDAYIEARASLIQECLSALALSKRAIIDFLEQQFDKQYLANVSTSLTAVRGGFMMMQELKAANLVQRSLDFIEQAILRAPVLPDERMLEILADALVGLSYYLERISSGAEAKVEILQITEQSLVELGYGLAN